MEKMRLITNFHDYYDHWFDGEGDMFRRVTTEGMDRKGMMAYLKSKKLFVPTFGIVKELKDEVRPESHVVVHTDTTVHQGEGKELMRFKDALEQHPNEFMTLYVSKYNGVSWRYLRVGDASFILKYVSDDWRSNYGTKEIIIESTDASHINLGIEYPLYAVDFVKAGNGTEEVMVALDYNIAPQVKGTGIEEILNAKAAAQKIKTMYAYLRNKKKL